MTPKVLQHFIKKHFANINANELEFKNMAQLEAMDDLTFCGKIERTYRYWHELSFDYLNQNSLGITCGEITNGNYTRNGASGWIEVKNSKQPNVSAGGDSGGSWFLYPGKATTITAVGIHSAGDDPLAKVEDFAIYMPIDYIDDHNSSISLILK